MLPSPPDGPAVRLAPADLAALVPGPEAPPRLTVIRGPRGPRSEAGAPRPIVARGAARPGAGRAGAGRAGAAPRRRAGALPVPPAAATLPPALTVVPGRPRGGWSTRKRPLTHGTEPGGGSESPSLVRQALAGLLEQVAARVSARIDGA